MSKSSLSNGDLIRFLVEDEDFQRLRARTNKFNTLKVLRVESFEIRHSNALAWLLNPKENHNFGDLIVKTFLIKVLLDEDNLEKFDETENDAELALQLYSTTFSDCQVHREKDDIDILLVNDSLKKVILIENKLRGKETDSQLEKYYTSVKKQYPDYALIPVFLTVEGEKPSHPKFRCASHNQVLEVLDYTVRHHSDKTSSDVLTFISHYIDILRDECEADEEFINECRKLYRENRDIVDTLHSSRSSEAEWAQLYRSNKEIIDTLYRLGNSVSIEMAANEFTRKHGVECVHLRRKGFTFVPKEFQFGKRENSPHAGGYPVYMYCFYDVGVLRLLIEAGKYSDGKMRVELLKSLQTISKIPDSRITPGGQYTRLGFNEYIEIDDWHNNDEILSGMEYLYSKAELYIKNMGEILSKFDWNQNSEDEIY